MPEVFLSTYYLLTGQELFLQFETPENTLNVFISAYRTNFGDTSADQVTNTEGLPDQSPLVALNTEFSDISATIRHIYLEPGIYNLSFDVIYNTGETKKIELETPITVYAEWPKYEQEKIRFLNETTLNFGNELENTWTLDQVHIQPNEFGDVDVFNTAISRLYYNYQYLKFNAQTINTNSPTNGICFMFIFDGRAIISYRLT
jgi:hypothetical protein